jgi:ribonuclease BN (tRNA processing enzyme)
MKQSLRIVGCRAGSPLYNQPASGSILRTERGSVLFDCGPGVLVSLTDEEFANLQAVVITHRHADHCLDLMALAYRLLFPLPKKPLALIGPPSFTGYD